MYNIKYKIGQEVYFLKYKYGKYRLDYGVIQKISVETDENVILKNIEQTHGTDIVCEIYSCDGCVKISEKFVIGVITKIDNDKTKRNLLENKLKELIKEKDLERKKSINKVVMKFTNEIRAFLENENKI